MMRTIWFPIRIFKIMHITSLTKTTKLPHHTMSHPPLHHVTPTTPPHRRAPKYWLKLVSLDPASVEIVGFSHWLILHVSTWFDFISPGLGSDISFSDAAGGNGRQCNLCETRHWCLEQQTYKMNTILRSYENVTDFLYYRTYLFHWLCFFFC